jgi:hypothetical protein
VCIQTANDYFSRMKVEWKKALLSPGKLPAFPLVTKYGHLTAYGQRAVK